MNDLKTLRNIWRLLRSLGQRRAVKQEIDEELRFHIEQRTAENIAARMSPEDAAREARNRFGNLQKVREECRERRGAIFGEVMLRDVRFALFQLRKNPGFTAMAVLTLALGFSMANSCAAQAAAPTNSFAGVKAGEEKAIADIRFCWCPPGRFIMGSPRGESERRPDEDQVEVTLTKGFWMAKFEASQGEWKRIMGKLPGPLTAELPEGDDFPVGNMSFAEVEAFCAKLTELGRQSGELPKDWEFRLPTEAQWEYACRAGTTTATSFGDQLSSKQANFKGKPYNGAEPGPSLSRAEKVGSYPANPWGLHDMHGNTFEWCRDWYHSKLPGGVDPDLHSAQSTAVPNRTGDHSRVRRGGAWTDDGWACRSAFRLRFEPHRRYDHIGFRVVVVKP